MKENKSFINKINQDKMEKKFIEDNINPQIDNNKFQYKFMLCFNFCSRNPAPMNFIKKYFLTRTLITPLYHSVIAYLLIIFTIGLIDGGGDFGKYGLLIFITPLGLYFLIGLISFFNSMMGMKFIFPLKKNSLRRCIKIQTVADLIETFVLSIIAFYSIFNWILFLLEYVSSSSDYDNLDLKSLIFRGLFLFFIFIPLCFYLLGQVIQISKLKRAFQVLVEHNNSY